MKTISTSSTGPKLRDLPKPALISPNDVLVDIAAVAICRTDLYAASGRIPVSEGRILGHEFSGIVSEVGSKVDSLSLGDRVVGCPSIPCGRCIVCDEGFSYQCANDSFLGLDRDGAFAEHIVVPEHSLFRIKDATSLRVATFFEPVAAGLGIFESNALSNGNPKSLSYAILGEGRIAELTRQLCLDYHFSEPDLISEISPDVRDRYDIIIEANAPINQIAAIIGALKVGGTLVLKSREPACIELPILEMIHRQIKIEAVRYGPFCDALNYVEENSQPLESYFDEGWALDSFDEAFRKAASCEEEKVWFSVV